MKLRITIIPKKFSPRFPMRTSRGAISVKTSYFVILEGGGGIGVGEGSPLPGLSMDGDTEWSRFKEWLDLDQDLPDIQNVSAYEWALRVATDAGVVRASSVLIALESAALSLLSGQLEIYWPSDFTYGLKSVAINGLVWMDGLTAMRRQAEEKVKAGFTIIKFKIGTHDWGTELQMLRDFRKHHPAELITIRVDANGAYTADQAYKVMDDLAQLDVHSIEQPIKPGQFSRMAVLVKDAPIPIGLDEELISAMPEDELLDMVRFINAPYHILKPTLIGGFATSEKLIEVVEESGKQWWLTSSLESPIALTSLAQFAARFDNPLPHGLSTGKIFFPEMLSPIHLEGQHLYFDSTKQFNIQQVTTPDPNFLDWRG